MAIPKVKSTYSLDVDSVRQLEIMAARWKDSKSEALRRAIRIASKQVSSQGKQALEALDRLQASLELTDETGTRWQKQLQAERRATSSRLAGKNR